MLFEIGNIFFKKFLEHSSFIVLCLFLLYSKVDQLYIHMCVFSVMFNSLQPHGP